MLFRYLMFLLLILSHVSFAFGDDAKPTTKRVECNGQTFTLPVGFTIELAAGPPIVNRPITASFDEQGRLYVADSSGSNENVQVQLQKKPHRILCIEDTDGDGRFDRTTVFADQMMFPEGTLWHAGSLYVAAPPVIWKLTDTDGDGKADKREVWFDGKTVTGCANDLHGPYLGPDGWIYWGKGAFAQQSYDRPGKAPLKTRAAHLFRARPDGTGVELVMTGGMDNPVGIAFTPEGERIFSTTFLQNPANGKRDGLIHAIYGGVYGKDYDVVYEHPWTSPALMPVLSHLGPAAPAGLTRYASTQFGAEYKNNLFTALFNMQKVTRHILEPDGSSFRSRDIDFVVSDNKDFHPTDVVEDADGSLLIVDTGGWYKLCCPTSQLVKPEVLGAIYRVRRTGAPQIIDPRGAKIDWAKASVEALAELLGDPRPAVRERAIQTLARRGDEVIPELDAILRSADNMDRRQNAIWTLTRIDSPKARTAVLRGVIDANERVRHAALHSIAVWRHADALAVVVPLLKGDSLPNRRVAAEALGRIGSARAVPALLSACSEASDRGLEHSLTYALIEIGAADATAAGLKSDSNHTRRAALIALDQMPAGKLQASQVIDKVLSVDDKLREAAWWIAVRHPEWGQDLVDLAKEASHRAQRMAVWLEREPSNELKEGRESYMRLLAGLSRAPALQQFVADQLRSEKREAKKVALEVMRRAGVKQMPTSWIDALSDALRDPSVDAEAVATLRSLPQIKSIPAPMVKALAAITEDAQRSTDIRLQALALLPAPPTSALAFVRSQLKPDIAPSQRSQALEALGRMKLSNAELKDALALIPIAGPMEINRLLEIFAQTNDIEVGRQLLASLPNAPARAAIRPDVLKSVVTKINKELISSCEEFLASERPDFAKQKAKLEELLRTLPEGDVRRGHVVFYSTKAACVACHTIGYLGGKVGPDLTRIGTIRTERDLLESIVFPSASFVRGYEPVTVTTRDGKIANGILRKEDSAGVALQVNADQQIFIASGDIEQILPSAISVMPAGLDQQISPRELADLVAFLKACR